MKRGVQILSALAIMAAVACNSNQAEGEAVNKDAVNTDMVNNPATASEEAVDPATLPAFTFDEEVYEFGEISQGEKVKHKFKFTNTGKSNLIISDAKGSCGCTVPIWPRNPIAPGEEGEIEVVFDSNGKQGRQHKTVTLTANTQPNTKVIAIKGDILVPETATNAQ